MDSVDVSQLLAAATSPPAQEPAEVQDLQQNNSTVVPVERVSAALVPETPDTSVLVIDPKSLPTTTPKPNRPAVSLLTPPNSDSKKEQDLLIAIAHRRRSRSHSFDGAKDLLAEDDSRTRCKTSPGVVFPARHDDARQAELSFGVSEASENADDELTQDVEQQDDQREEGQLDQDQDAYPGKSDGADQLKRGGGRIVPAVPKKAPATTFVPRQSFASPDPFYNPNNTTNVYINGLPPFFSHEQLLRLAAEFGKVLSCRVFHRFNQLKPNGNGQMEGSTYAFVLYETIEEAESCIVALRKYSDIHPSFARTQRMPAARPPQPTTAEGLLDRSRPAYRGSPPREVPSQPAHQFVSAAPPLLPPAELAEETDVLIYGLPSCATTENVDALVHPHRATNVKFIPIRTNAPSQRVAHVNFSSKLAAVQTVTKLHLQPISGWSSGEMNVYLHVVVVNPAEPSRPPHHQHQQQLHQQQQQPQQQQRTFLPQMQMQSLQMGSYGSSMMPQGSPVASSHHSSPRADTDAAAWAPRPTTTSLAIPPPHMMADPCFAQHHQNRILHQAQFRNATPFLPQERATANNRGGWPGSPQQWGGPGFPQATNTHLNVGGRSIPMKIQVPPLPPHLQRQNAGMPYHSVAAANEFELPVPPPELLYGAEPSSAGGSSLRTPSTGGVNGWGGGRPGPERAFNKGKKLNR